MRRARLIEQRQSAGISQAGLAKFVFERTVSEEFLMTFSVV